MRTDPQTVFDRIKRRARCEEQYLSLDYLKNLNYLHERWLNLNETEIGASLLILDANDELSIM